MTPEQIQQNALAVRNAGIPDMLNRWLAMTPEAWAANVKAREKINRAQNKGEVRELPKAERRKAGSLLLPRSMDDTARAILKEQRVLAEKKKQERFARLRELKEEKMAQKIGPREQALRDARASQTRGKRSLETTPVRPAQPTAEAVNQEQDMAATKKKTAKTSKARTSVKGKTKPAKTAEATTGGVRPGSKLEIIVGLLKRPEGCTTKEALAATGWPSLSFNQQAKAAGLTIRKEKQGSTTRYWAE